MNYQAPPPYNAPAPKKRTLPIVLGVIGAVVVLCLGGFIAIGIFADNGSNKPAGAATSAPAAADSQSADPARDLNAGEPDALCATNRLGKHFEKDGVQYTCKGPKPYRWRRD